MLPIKLIYGVTEMPLEPLLIDTGPQEPHKTITRLVLGKFSVTLIQSAPYMFKINTEIWAVKLPLGRGTGWPARTGSPKSGEVCCMVRLSTSESWQRTWLLCTKPASQFWVHLNSQQIPDSEPTLSSRSKEDSSQPSRAALAGYWK